MTNEFSWNAKKLTSSRVDPYSRWLVDAKLTHWDLESGQQGEDNLKPWVLSRVRDNSSVQEIRDWLAAEPIGADGIGIWAPSGEDHAFTLSQRSLPTTEPTAADPDVLESYLQLAPFDGHECGAIDVGDPEDPDMSRFGIDQDKAVIFGVIDDGINVAHENFLDRSNNSRVDFFWLQDGFFQEESSVLFGREVASHNIECILGSHDTEEGVLRKLGLINHASKRPSTLSKAFSHGTFVLDALAGYENHQFGTQNHQRFESQNRRIVSVQLHRRVTEESSGAHYSMFAILGLQYIVDRARRVAKALRNGVGKKIPLIVNFSYGFAGGPHDGRHQFEQFVDLMVDKLDNDPDLGPLILPMPTGNRHLVNGHAHKKAQDDSLNTLELSWATQPADPSSNYLEVWLPFSDLIGPSIQTVSVSLVPPFAGSGEEFKAVFDFNSAVFSHGHDMTDSNGRLLARVSIDVLDLLNPKDSSATVKAGKARILITLAPTYPAGGDGSSIPPGIWSVKVEKEQSEGEYIEAWIPRDDSPPFFRRPGRQSYLIGGDADHERRILDELSEFVMPFPEGMGVSRYGALNGLATAAGMLRVGGTRAYDDNLPAIYSGAPHKGMVKVELSAPADRSRVYRGLVGMGGKSGSTQVMNGTSVSAPLVGRAIADFLVSKRDSLNSGTAIADFIKSLAPIDDEPNNSKMPNFDTSKKYIDLIYELDAELKSDRLGITIPIAKNPRNMSRFLRR